MPSIRPAILPTLLVVGCLLPFSLHAQVAANHAAPPEFLLRQLLFGSSESHFQIPGRWQAAIKAESGLTPDAIRGAYLEHAGAAGLTPFGRDSLMNNGLYRAMGVYRREEMVRAAVETLERMRSGITRDTLAARFDYLFRPAGKWQVDIHDYALARVNRTLPTVTWETARPALAAAGLLPANAPAELETIPLALYRLYALRDSDSLTFNATLAQMRTPDAQSRQAVLAFLEGYESAAQWYVAALRLLLEQPVFDPRASLAGMVTSFWGSPGPAPEIQAHSYGYPEGATRIGVDSALLARLVQPLNATAQEWWARHRTPDLVTAIHLLPAPTNNTILEFPDRRYRVMSVGQAGRESFSGFLEPRDLILLDPSYEPLLALGTLVHEWQHVLHEHRREAVSLTTAADGSLQLVPLNPYLAEGLAEWSAEQILAPLADRYPLLRFGEVEKRMSLVEQDPHVLGYAMIRTLNSALGDPAKTLALVVSAGSDPALVLRDSRVAAAWRRFSGPDRLIPRRSGVSVIPETRFQIVDETPDVLETRIRIEGIDRN